MTKKFNNIQVQQFWQMHERFLKTELVTEAPNPLTLNLATLCQTDLITAFNLFKQVEVNAITILNDYIEQLVILQTNIANCFKHDGRVFLVGCGASGRLAMLLKRLYESYFPKQMHKIIALSAAGDISLIKAVEQFEDKAEFGVSQLIWQGFTANDLLIGLTASGESPFILATIEYAANISKYSPYLICNNKLNTLTQRNKTHIATNPKVMVLDLVVGEMALTGSTRLQATTVMQIAVGLALLENCDIPSQITTIINTIENFPLEKLAVITTIEAAILKKNQYILYKTNNHLLGLSLLADITERAPTFNLVPFENINEASNNYSPFYLSLDNITTVAASWQFLFGQMPTCLNWSEFPATTTSYINGFDLSSTSARAAASYLPDKQYQELWQIHDWQLTIQLDQIKLDFTLPKDFLQASLIYKLCLNSHSTLMMGSLGYFSGNMMLSLKPSNFKLIDRAIRYSQFILLKQHNITIDYTKLAQFVFQEIEKLAPNQSIVRNVVEAVIASTAQEIKA